MKIICGPMVTPPKWYGLAYMIYTTDEGVFYPMPIHLFVRAFINIWIFFRYLGGPDRISKAYHEGYKDGLEARINREVKLRTTAPEAGAKND